jgi:predicted DCC family thiol-disulfide oxidoreductase YuxK
MKTLTDHVILYDNECPMCDLYTSAFVKTGMLPENGRVGFTDANEIIKTQAVDRNRACDEIALINVKDGSVVYGVASLMTILQNRFPILRHLFRIHAFKFFAAKAYAFVSYNRKVIIPGKDISNTNACRPGFNVRYRLIYLCITWLITSFVLANFTNLLVPLIPAGNFYREFLICGGQIIFQGVVVSILDRQRAWEYLGNLMTISFAGALLLTMVFPFQAILTPLVAAGIFAAVVSFMFLEHMRRVKLLRLPWIMTLSWVMYRVLILAFLI